jgi:hypothetical protein
VDIAMWWCVIRTCIAAITTGIALSIMDIVAVAGVKRPPV